MSRSESAAGSIESLNTFTEAMDSHGPDIDSWPLPLREPAALFLAQSAQAERLLLEARTLETLLQRLQVEPAATGLSTRIVASLPVDRWQRTADWFTSNLWRPLLVATAPLVLGFLIGVLQQDVSSLRDQLLAEELSQMVFSNDFEELPYEN
jgi:hypothetical protein